MDSSSHNWLAFSLSNHSSLFHHSFSSTPPGSTVDASPQAAVGGGGATNSDLSVFAGAGPKFEDFLGGASSSTTSVTAVVPTPPHFSTDNAFGSELKTMTAGFLPGLAAAEQSQPQKQSLALAVPSSKKTADTFGQRTSIYRGVTRYTYYILLYAF